MKGHYKKKPQGGPVNVHVEDTVAAIPMRIYCINMNFKVQHGESRLPREPSHPNGMVSPHSLQQKRHARDPVGQGIVAGWVQEIFFCHGSCPWEYHALQGEIHTPLFGFPKEPENLALPTGLGP